MSASDPRRANAAGTATLVPVLENNRFDEAALLRYLSARLAGFGGEVLIRQFQGGFSNPTFHLQTRERAYVLRKKPPGRLLPSAHAVDREYRVLAALARTDVPVPPVHLLCEDESVIGTVFYVMDHVEGRIYADRLLPDCAVAERSAMYDSMNDVLARLHRVDHREVGLENFGKPSGYVARQVARWTQQYQASRVDELPAMDRLIDWLPKHLPAQDEAAIAHGDYRLGNLLFHPTEPRVVAVLDWELATIGHPIGDLAYCCTPYHLPSLGNRGFAGHDLDALGIPAEAQFLADYCRRTGRRHIEDWIFFIVFSLFRSAAILAGVYRRSLDGQAVDARMAEAKEACEALAGHAWTLARASSG